MKQPKRGKGAPPMGRQQPTAARRRSKLKGRDARLGRPSHPAEPNSEIRGGFCPLFHFQGRGLVYLSELATYIEPGVTR